MHLYDFAQLALEIAMRHSASITSWYRTQNRNRAVGGHPQSKHLQGLAVDLVPDDTSSKHAIIADASAAGLLAIDEGDHIHIQVRGKEASK